MNEAKEVRSHLRVCVRAVSQGMLWTGSAYSKSVSVSSVCVLIDNNIQYVCTACYVLCTCCVRTRPMVLREQGGAPALMTLLTMLL